MKTKEYIAKYRLDCTNRFNQSEFMEDLLLDLMTLLEIGKSPDKGMNIKGFENAVNALRQKWNAIHNKTVSGGLPEKLWGYFYATKIIRMKQELFPEQMERRKKEREERHRIREEEQRMYDDMGRDFFQEWLRNAYATLFAKMSVPESSFSALGLDVASTEEEVKVAFRKLAMEHHPDKGGRQEYFISITEAKNRCLIYLKQKSN